MIERLPFDETSDYIPSEIAVHVNRYAVAEPYCKCKRVLDIACGEGYGSLVMAQKWGAREVVGVDISNEAISKASALFCAPNITFREGSAEELPQLGLDSFDLIVCLETFEHVADPTHLLRCFQKVLAPGGHIIVSCPNDNLYYDQESVGNAFHVRRYSLEEFAGICEEVLGPGSYLLGTGLAGFVNIPVTSPYLLGTSSYAKEVHGLRKIEPVTHMFTSSQVISGKNASYYVGVWGVAAAAVKETLGVVPTDREPYFVQQKFDECLRKTWEIDRLKARIAELETRLLSNSQKQENSAIQLVRDVRPSAAARVKAIIHSLKDRCLKHRSAS